MPVHGAAGAGEGRLEAIAEAFAEAAREAQETLRAHAAGGASGDAAMTSAAAAWASHVAVGLIEGAMKSFAEAIDHATAAGASPRAAAAALAAAPAGATPSRAAPGRAVVAAPARPARATAPRPAARTTSARAAKAVAPRPKNAHAVSAGRKMNQLATTVRNATADGHVDATEKKAIEALANAGLAHAEKLVRAEGDPAIAADNKVLNFLKTGKLELHAQEAVDGVLAGRTAMLAQVDKDAKTNAFAHLPGSHWKAPFHGVRTKDYAFEGKSVHVVAIDLADPRIALQTNGPGSKGRTVKGQAEANHAELAINGDFFSWNGFRPSETAMAGGHQWGGADGPIMAFNGARADVKRGGTVPEWAQNAVGGRPMVLKDGAVIDNAHHVNGGVERRTGTGLSKDGRVMYLVAGGSLSANQLGRLMKSLGADDAIAMDGGGSAQMYQAGRGLVQASSDPGGQRHVANTIMIQAQRKK